MNYRENKEGKLNISPRRAANRLMQRFSTTLYKHKDIGLSIPNSTKQISSFHCVTESRLQPGSAAILASTRPGRSLDSVLQGTYRGSIRNPGRCWSHLPGFLAATIASPWSAVLDVSRCRSTIHANVATMCGPVIGPEQLIASRGCWIAKSRRGAKMAKTRARPFVISLRVFVSSRSGRRHLTVLSPAAAST